MDKRFYTADDREYSTSYRDEIFRDEWDLSLGLTSIETRERLEEERGIIFMRFAIGFEVLNRSTSPIHYLPLFSTDFYKQRNLKASSKLIIYTTILTVSNQFVHGKVRSVDSLSWVFFIVVYASPNVTVRRGLWGCLAGLNPGPDVPWLLGGDFNSILRLEERTGDAIRGNGVSQLFHDFILDNGLLEATFRGEVFTWKRGQLWKRLDRCLFNDKWVSCFPASIVSHLDRVGSDHCPLLLHYPKQDGDRVNRPFRFIAAWQDHPRFSDFLGNIWDANLNIESNVVAFADKARVWNESLDIDLRAELAEALKESNGAWCSDQLVLRDRVVQFYQDLFTSGPDIDVSLATSGCFHPCTNAMSQSAYSLSSSSSSFQEDSLWKLVARFSGIPRIRSFLWLVVHGRILTNVERVHRHFSNDMRCGVCGLDVESIDHLFQKCPPAVSLWTSLVRPGDLSAFLSMDGRLDLWEECTQLYDQCLVARTYARQQPPAVRVNGEQVQHCRFVGRCAALEAEFWGVLEGLRLAWSRQVEALVLEVDSLEVYECLLYRKSCGGFSSMVHSIFELLDRPWKVFLSRVPRSANKVADGLAKLCHVPAVSEVLVFDNFSAHVFFDPPVSLLHLMQDDLSSASGFS
ncbi:hypothetical protein GQ457_07G012830 [Hibiscus cannabinus]